MRKIRWLCCALVLCSTCTSAQTSPPLTWEQVRERFEQQNPTLLADRLNIDESKAQEITANLPPNPNLPLLTDGTQIAPYQSVWRPFAGTDVSTSFSYLLERQHKRQWR